jgi:ferredoxin
VIRQDGDTEELVQEAIDTCPVNCIHWADYTEIKVLEAERKNQILAPVGFPMERVSARRRSRRR